MFGLVRWNSAILALAIATVIAGEGCKRKDADPFPVSGAITGWEKTSETRVYKAKDLWQYIDGDAEQYLKAGVVSMSTSDYKYQNQLEAVVDVYTMGDSAGAKKILESGQTRDAKGVQHLGDAGFAYTQSVIFRKGRCFVRILAYEDSPGAQQALVALAQGIETNL